MKKYGSLLVLLVGMSLLWANSALRAEPGTAFEKIKALAGEWEGKAADGNPVKASYQITSNDSAVVESMKMGDHPSMVTVYHMDNSDLRMTHFCSVGNQPRMKANPGSGDGRVVSFDFVDATNLAKSTDGHMHNLQISFLDNDHIRHKWTWLQDGQSRDNVFDLTRVK